MKLISTSRLIFRDESGFYKYFAATRLFLLHSLVPLRLSTASSFAPIPSDIRLGSCLRESLDGRESPAPDDWWHRRSRRLALRLACQSLWRFPDTNALTRKGFAATLPTREFETRSPGHPSANQSGAFGRSMNRELAPAKDSGKVRSRCPVNQSTRLGIRQTRRALILHPNHQA